MCTYDHWKTTDPRDAEAGEPEHLYECALCGVLSEMDDSNDKLVRNHATGELEHKLICDECLK